MKNSTLLPNLILHGYQTIRQLGYNSEGGRITYLAINNKIKQEVVIKEFSFARPNAGWTGYQVHEREVEILQKLNHPRIPRYLDSFETESGFCLVQEYKNAPSLAQKNVFNPEEVKKIAISILEILSDLQFRKDPVFHKDIKPENILVGEDLNTYLIDFGLSRMATDSMAASSYTAGTLGFMPPEQIYNKPLTKASDLYSLGITLICLLTKTPSTEVGQFITPKGGLNFVKKLPPLHPDFIKWLKKMVETDAKDRFSNAGEALNKLRSIPVQGLSLTEVLQRKKVFQSVTAIAAFSGLVWGIIVIGNDLKQKQIAKQIAEQNRQITNYKERDIELVAAQKAAREEQIAAQKAAREEQIAEQNRIKAEQELQEKRKRDRDRLLLNKSCFRCDLQGVDLSDQQLEGADLRGADLRGANLDDANLNNAQLQNANLRGANLSSADFENAQLQGVQLQGADITLMDADGANLTGANLTGATFSLPPYLDKTILTNAIMTDGTKHEIYKQKK